jgi:hypothetical protein
MNCQQIEKLLGEYLDLRLEPGRKARVIAHLVGCARCREQLAALQNLRKALQSCPSELPPEGFVERAQQAVRKRTMLPAPSPWMTLRWLAPAAALLLISLVAWWPHQYQARSRAASELQSLGGAKQQAAPKPEASRRPKSLAYLSESGETAKTKPRPNNAFGKTPAAEKEAGAPPPPSAPMLKPQGTSPEAAKAFAEKSINAGGDKTMASDRVRPAPPTRGLASPGGVSGLPKNVARRSREAAQAPLEADTRLEPAILPSGGLPAQAALSPISELRVQSRTGGGGVQELLLQAAPGESGKFTLSPAAPERATPGRGLPLAPVSLDQAQNITPSGKPAVWEITLRPPPSAGAPAASSKIGGGPAETKRYLLLVPSRLKENEIFSVEYKRRPPMEVLRDISEKGGLLVLAPAELSGKVTLTAEKFPAPALLRLVAEQLSLRYHQQGRLHYLE